MSEINFIFLKLTISPSITRTHGHIHLMIVLTRIIMSPFHFVPYCVIFVCLFRISYGSPFRKLDKKTILTQNLEIGGVHKKPEKLCANLMTLNP